MAVPSQVALQVAGRPVVARPEQDTMLPGPQTRRPVEIDQLDLEASSCNPAAPHELEDTATFGLLWTLDLRGYRGGASGERRWWEHLGEMTPEERAELADGLTADLPEDDPMIAIVRRVLGMPPGGGEPAD